MCGICGIFNFHPKERVEYSVLKRMCDVLAHRGPDDEGIVVDGNAGIGMRRLSIIDLATGHQPIANEDESVWIVCNGEIYNHLELRKDLEKRGHIFRTYSDVEAVLHGYEEYGEECPKKLNGMFAFIIWDKAKDLFLLARDRLGVKPLYYYLNKGVFLSASELKSILQVHGVSRKIDFKALDKYLTFEYIPAPLSIFEDIKKLLPGHILVLKNGTLKIKQYWNIIPKRCTSTEEGMEEKIMELLQDSVKLRLMSDVPIGVFLSGGIDSSIIAALMAKVMDRPVKTFSIGFEDSTYDELKFSRLMAKRLNSEHNEFIIRPDAVELTERLLTFLDEPFGDFSIFPTYLVSKMAREYVTVVLSGDGGDELFAGYDTYIADKLEGYYNRIPFFVRRGIIGALDLIPPSSKKKGLINRAKRFVEGTKLAKDLKHTRWMVFLQPWEKEQLYSDDLKKENSNESSYDFIYDYFKEAAYYDRDDLLNQKLYVDIKTYLADDILVKVDRMSMAVSLEAREPFLDYRLVEYVSSLPGRVKLKGVKTKWVLKKAAAKILPHEIANRGKEGFSIPIKNWLKRELKPMMSEFLSQERIKREGFFNPDYIERLKKEHLDGVENHSHRLWALMVFEIWKDRYL